MPILRPGGVVACGTWCQAGQCPLVTSIGAGESHNCVSLSNGHGVLLGQQPNGQLGPLTVSQVTKPTQVAAINYSVAVSVGQRHTCSILTDGTVECWGKNSSGQLGAGFHNASVPVPQDVPSFGYVLDLALGSDHSCARTSSGTVTCWGANYAGQLGSKTYNSKPVLVPGLLNAAGIASGRAHTCTTHKSDAVRCWVDNSSGQLGDGTSTNVTHFVDATGVQTAVQVAAGDSFTCASAEDGSVWCWGANSSGQLGQPPSSSVPLPSKVPGVALATHLAAGYAHVCAIVGVSATVQCRGDNSAGQLGDGASGSNQHLPQTVPGLSDVVLLAAGAAHTCALTNSGKVYCWGDNKSGQLGDATTEPKLVPTPVAC